MPAVNQNATIYRGGSYAIAVPLKDASGDPLDTTGVDLFYRVAKQASSRSAVVSLTRETDPAITNEADVVTIPLPTAKTKDLGRNIYYHELFMVEDGERHVLMTGQLTVVQSQAAQLVP